MQDRWHRPLRKRWGGPRRLLGLRVYYDFDWIDVFPSYRAQFRGGLSMALLARSECPDDLKPVLLLTDDANAPLGRIHTAEEFAVVVHISTYLSQSGIDPAAAYFAHQVDGQISRLGELGALQAPLSAQATSQAGLRETAHHIQSWLAADPSGVAELQELGISVPLIGDARVSAIVGALRSWDTIGPVLTELLVDMLPSVIDEASREALLEALAHETDASGSDQALELGTFLSAVQNGTVELSELLGVGRVLGVSLSATAQLAVSDVGSVLLSGLQTAHQQAYIEELRDLVDNPQTTEPELQRSLQEETWVFGGRFIGQANRRGITVLDQVDIPLLRADGALHVVELKPANIPDLVKPYRNHHVVGSEVNEAVGQVSNYLREFDEQRDSILTRLNIETSRASGTVVVGHPQYVNNLDRETIHTALRTYNGHLSRIEVITYEDVIEGALRSLSLVSEAS